MDPHPLPEPKFYTAAALLRLSGSKMNASTSEVRTSHFRWSLILAHVNHEHLNYFYLWLFNSDVGIHLQLILVSLKQGFDRVLSLKNQSSF